MAKKVIIAEKPSVAKNIAEALNIKIRKDGYIEGQDYFVSWAFGHLLQLYDAKDYDTEMALWRMEKFPFIPQRFKYKVKSDSKDKSKKDSGANKQINIIKALVLREDVDAVISACDFDREGQIIGDTILKYLRISKPIYRLLLNEWTPKEVLAGLNKLKPNEDMKPMQDAGISRQWADWVIGINLTSVATLKYQRGKGRPLNIGRVILPTLKIIYDRDKEVESFVPNDYFKLQGTFKTEKNEEYDGTYTLNGEEKFNDKKELEAVLNNLTNKNGTIVDKEVEKKKEYPPYLFNLSNLQGFVTSKNKGWTSDKVLTVAQGLYEKKHITYPRTASSVLEESLTHKAEEVLKLLKKGLPFEDEIKFQVTKRIFDNSKVESHSAIIPTYILPKTLTGDEAVVYNAIKNRFLVQFMPIAEVEETKITTKIDDPVIQGMFISKGKVQIVEGWKKVEKIESKDTILPLINIKEPVQLVDSKITSHKTTAPKYHIEKTLLRVMETCGKKVEEEDSNDMMDAILSGFSIGTPATRAETIKKLKDIGYIYGKDKSLLCTDLGKRMVEHFPIKELFDLEYTGRLEKTLSDIEKGKFNKEDFLKLIFKFVASSVNTIKRDKTIILNDYNNKSNSSRGNKSGVVKKAAVNKENDLNKKLGSKDDSAVETYGKCPLCGHDIIEGKKGFGCSNWKNGCKFVIWKEDDFIKSINKKITKTIVKKLLKSGKAELKGIAAKDGTKFDGYLSYLKNNVDNNFSWKLVRK
ncbi:type IA DNA topoisomerase [Candidatus Clostridium stratigraminis]|uniref:DNA topoisomerase n=1 Tax=Candidatus Clostridium stratigraminis TaxID=3381661 RepID=A0ABW8T277_9CLOT